MGPFLRTATTSSRRRSPSGSIWRGTGRTGTPSSGSFWWRAVSTGSPVLQADWSAAPHLEVREQHSLHHGGLDWDTVVCTATVTFNKSLAVLQSRILSLRDSWPRELSSTL